MMKLTDTISFFPHTRKTGIRPCAVLSSSTVPNSSYQVDITDEGIYRGCIWLPKDLLDLTLLEFVSMYRLGLIQSPSYTTSRRLEHFINVIMWNTSNE